MPAPRTHPARLVFLCVVLGTFTTIAVSWSIAALATVPMYPRTHAYAFVAWNRPWNVAQATSFGIESNWWGDFHADGPGEPDELVRAFLEKIRARTDEFRPEPVAESITWGRFASEPSTAANVLGHDIAFGWPRPCLWYQVTGVWTATATGGTLSGGVPVGGILIEGAASARGSDFKALPYRVIWLRLLVNIAFWSLIWCALLLVPRFIRRAHRRRRGLCLACAYDRRATPAGAPCPECGALPR